MVNNNTRGDAEESFNWGLTQTHRQDKTIIPSRVPLGIAAEGSFRSPLKLAPATIPVQDGK